MSYYAKGWNWTKIEVRKSLAGEKMLIVPFNPFNLTNEELSKKKESLKYYFQNGPGKECDLQSLYFYSIDPKSEFKLNNKSFDLLFGLSKFEEKIGELKFALFPSSYYPSNFSGYANLHTTLAEQVSKTNREMSIDVVVELDEVNGFLAALIRNHCRKFYTIQHYRHNIENIELNLKQSGCPEDYYGLLFNYNKIHYYLDKIIKENGGENCRITFVYQNSSSSLIELFKKKKKEFLIKLRERPQIKSIILISNLASPFKLVQNVYELMAAERKRKELNGEKFDAVDATLVDYRRGSASCNALIRLQRD